MGIKKVITLLALLAFSWVLAILLLYVGVTLYRGFLG
jgi:hypothetical protein